MFAYGLLFLVFFDFSFHKKYFFPMEFPSFQQQIFIEQNTSEKLIAPLFTSKTYSELKKQGKHSYFITKSDTT